jgi:hypothetical protein
MKDVYWLEKRIEGLEDHVNNLYEIIEEWQKLVEDKNEMINELLKNE